MNPYFSVGEEVILCSLNNPELNGEYTITKITGIHDCKIIATGQWIRGITYALSPPVGEHNRWQQSALRKKHKGSDKSFDEIVKSLHLTGVAS